MARTVRNAKIDTRSARLKLLARREPYWTVISAGCALGYRRGAKGGSWIGRFRGSDGRQNYAQLGAADDARDADDLTVFNFAQAQARARSWFQRKAREDAGDLAPLGRPYTVADALADYRADYLRRGGKAADRLDWTTAAYIIPETGWDRITELTKARIVAWHQKIAETPPRLRTKPGAEQSTARLTRGAGGDPPTTLDGQPRTDNPQSSPQPRPSRGQMCTDDAWRTVRALSARPMQRVCATFPTPRRVG